MYSHLDASDQTRKLAALPVVPSAALALQPAVETRPTVSNSDHVAVHVKRARSKQKPSDSPRVSQVGRAGIEPATHGFSVHCSTS